MAKRPPKDRRSPAKQPGDPGTPKEPTASESPPVPEESLAPAKPPGLLSGIPRPLPLVAQVEQTLRSAIREGLFADGPFPTLQELSQQLGVSRETVRLALTALQHDGLIVKQGSRGLRVNWPTAPVQRDAPPKNVLGYLQEQYELEGAGAETVVRPHSSAMLEGAIVEAGRHDYQLIARSAKSLQLREAFGQMKALGPLGGVIFACVSDEKFLRRLSGQGLPGVLMDHDMYLPKIGSIRGDSQQNAEIAIEHLVQLGHQRIACATWRQNDLNPWFIQGYRRAMRTAELPRRKAWEIEVELNQRGATESLQQLLSLSPRPTALICFHNTFASQVIAEALGQGLCVPGDLSVVGGGGERVTDLTCTHFDWHQLGRQAVGMVLKAIEEGEQHEPEHRLIPYQWKESGSTAAVDANPGIPRSDGT